MKRVERSIRVEDKLIRCESSTEGIDGASLVMMILMRLRSELIGQSIILILTNRKLISQTSKASKWMRTFSIVLRTFEAYSWMRFGRMRSKCAQVDQVRTLQDWLTAAKSA
jgi:hypothetical protein